jgi:hypothetical protein
MNTEVIDAAPRVSSTALATTNEMQAGPLAMAMQAMKAGMSIADMRAMLDLQKDWEANEARKAYVQAMSEFKQNPPEILKRKEVAFNGTQYMHATLGDVTQAIMQALAEHGISHRWDTTQSNGQIVVTCILTHKLGHSESTTLEGAPDDSGKKNRIQQMASTVTYLQRYTLLAATGLATKDMEDDDGRGGQHDNGAMLQEWITNANAATTVEVLRETRKMAGEAFSAAQDVEGWNAFKLVASVKKEALEGAKP